jgi:hypothetical protein
VEDSLLILIPYLQRRRGLAQVLRIHDTQKGRLLKGSDIASRNPAQLSYMPTDNKALASYLPGETLYWASYLVDLASKQLLIPVASKGKGESPKYHNPWF